MRAQEQFLTNPATCCEEVFWSAAAWLPLFRFSSSRNLLGGARSVLPESATSGKCPRHGRKNTLVKFDLGSKEGKRKTLRAKVLGGSLGNSTSSLAVFYVEQVALNRHVSPQPQQLLLCLSHQPMSRTIWPVPRAIRRCPGFHYSFIFLVKTSIRSSREIE